MKRSRWFLTEATAIVILASVAAVQAQPAPQPPASPPAGPAERQPPETASAPSSEGLPQERPRVALEIECEGQPWGTIVLELHAQRVPATVANFLRYVDEGFYDGTIFHRVVPGFIIQGGGYVSPEEQKLSGLHEPIRNESRGAQKNRRGTVAMARKRDPHSAVCQFFINLADNEMLDFPKAGTYGYCVFGEVVQGMEIVDRIAALPTRVSPLAQRRFEVYQRQGKRVSQAEQSLPLTPPVIRKARRLLPDEVISPAPATQTVPAAAEPAAELPATGDSQPGAEPVPPPGSLPPAGRGGGRH